MIENILNVNVLIETESAYTQEKETLVSFNNFYKVSSFQFSFEKCVVRNAQILSTKMNISFSGRVQYDLNDDEILSNRGHLNTLPATHIRHTNQDSELSRERDDRYPLTTQSSHLSSGRRERSVEDYSPHRAGGSNRRVLNAM